MTTQPQGGPKKAPGIPGGAERRGGMVGGTTAIVTPTEINAAQSEHRIVMLRNCFDVTTNNVVEHMRLIGGSRDRSSIVDSRPNMDYVTVASGSNGEDGLRLYASGFWVALHGGEPFVIGSAHRVNPEMLFPDLILLGEPSVAAISMAKAPSETMESVLDPEIPIGDRKRTFIQSIEPHFNAYVTTHKEQLLKKLLGGLQVATDNLSPITKTSHRNKSRR